MPVALACGVRRQAADSRFAELCRLRFAEADAAAGEMLASATTRFHAVR